MQTNKLSKKDLIKRWQDLIWFIQDTKGKLLELWDVKIGDLVISNLGVHNEPMKVESTKVTFYEDGFAYFWAEGKSVDTGEECVYSETVADVLWKIKQNQGSKMTFSEEEIIEMLKSISVADHLGDVVDAITPITDKLGISFEYLEDLQRELFDE